MKFKIPFIKSSQQSALLLGIALGIISQRIPELKAYTDKIIDQLEQQALKDTSSSISQSRHKESPLFFK